MNRIKGLERDSRVKLGALWFSSVKEGRGAGGGYDKNKKKKKKMNKLKQVVVFFVGAADEGDGF